MARRGFTMIELIVVLVVLAMVGAVVVPNVLDRLEESEASTLASTLESLRGGLLEYRGDVRRYPTHLRYLSTAPATASDICGLSVPASYLSGWQGPYVNRTIGTTGLRVGEATVLDSIVRNPATFLSTTTGELTIRVSDVDSAVARQIKRRQDVTTSFSAGTIRWTNVSNGRGTLQMVIPARGC